MVEIHKWHGLRELDQNLKMLGEQMREKGVRRMMSQAAVPMRDEAKRRAPVLKEPDPRRMPGTVRNAIQIWRKRATQFAATYYVGVRRLSRGAIKRFKSNTDRQGKALAGADNPNDPFYWRFLGDLEVGRSNMPSQPFLRPAFESKKMESVKVALDEGRSFVKRTVRRFKKTRK